MYYYFDESGNWQGYEKHRLVLGGLMLKNKQLEIDINNFFKIEQSKIGGAQLHAADVAEQVKESCYIFISELLEKKEANILIRIYDKNFIKTKSIKKADQMYSEEAADLASTLALGDKYVNIIYDLKFYYAYPENVLKEMINLPHHFKIMQKNFNITDAGVMKKQQQLVTLIRKILSNARKNNYTKKSLEYFLSNIIPSEIKVNPLSVHDKEKLNNDYNRIKSIISQYMWTELMLKIEGNDHAREIFRIDVLKSFKNKISSLNISTDMPEIKIYFSGKHEENPGVQVIDFICNLVYRYGLELPKNISPAIKKIYNRIKIEEISK